MKALKIQLFILCCLAAMTVQAQTVVFDEQKQKQWQSMENGA